MLWVLASCFVSSRSIRTFITGTRPTLRSLLGTAWLCVLLVLLVLLLLLMVMQRGGGKLARYGGDAMHLREEGQPDNHIFCTACRLASVGAASS